jgi:hypothetical protein
LPSEKDNPAVQLLMVGEDSDYDEEDDQVFKNKIAINDLWITAQDIRRLLDCGGIISRSQMILSL